MHMDCHSRDLKTADLPRSSRIDVLQWQQYMNTRYISLHDNFFQPIDHRLPIFLISEKNPFGQIYFREKQEKTHILKHSRVIWWSWKSRFKISAHEMALPTPPPYPVHTMLRCSPDWRAFLANSVTFGTVVPPFTCIHRKSSGKFSIFMSFLVNSSSTFLPFL